MPSFFILLNIYFLRGAVRGTGPVTRGVVVQISLAMAGIVWGAVLALLNLTWQAIWLNINWQAEANRKTLDLISDFTKLTKDLTGTLFDKIEALESAQRESTDAPGTLRTVLTRIKRLFGAGGP